MRNVPRIKISDMETLKLKASITFNGLDRSLEIDLGGGLYFNIDRDNPIYVKLIRSFSKGCIHKRITLLNDRGRKLNAIALIKDYQDVNLKEAKDIYDSKYR
jgi:hypothetical protein